jgi:hypothetical protein
MLDFDGVGDVSGLTSDFLTKAGSGLSGGVFGGLRSVDDGIKLFLSKLIS